MGELEQDLVALEWFTKSWMPPCLRIPVAARDINAIVKFVGKVEIELSRPGSESALLVRVSDRAPPPEKRCELDLPVWKMDAAAAFHWNPQVWVDIDYGRYRSAYARAFPDLDISRVVVDHIENRRRARKIGWKYVRLCHVSTSVNVSSGQSAERLGVSFAETTTGGRMRWGQIKYADVADLTKMLGIRIGGGPQDGLRDALRLFEPVAGSSHRGPCWCDRKEAT